MLNRTEEEKRLLEKAFRFLPGGSLGNVAFSDDDSFIVKRGQGSKIWDVSGNEYIDYLMGSGPMILGHSHPSVVHAVLNAVENGSTFFTTNESAVLLAEELVKAIPSADKVRFTTSGTDACFQALRIARAFRQRDRILKFEGGFHGSSDYSLMSNPPQQLYDFPKAEASSAGVPRIIEELVIVAPFNNIDVTTSIIEKHHQELAAVIVEPVQRILSPTPGFLESLREITSYYEIPLIFDEVVTGFRMAYGGAQEFYGVTPDLTAVGKIMGGGFPLGAVCGREDIMAVYDPNQAKPDNLVSQIGTLNGNPIAAVAGIATLKELRKEGTYQYLWQIGRELRNSLDNLCSQAEIPAQTSGVDPVFDIIFTNHPLSDYRSTLTGNNQLNNLFRSLLQKQSVFRGPQKFYPSLAHSVEDIEYTKKAFATVIEQVLESTDTKD